MGCCERNPESDHPAAGDAGGRPRSERKFQEFLQAAAAPGALDGKTKQAIAIALSVMARCEPCVKSHVKKAREMGFSQEEIDEAAWVAISFGGSPTMVFYNGVRKVLEPTLRRSKRSKLKTPDPAIPLFNAFPFVSHEINKHAVLQIHAEASKP